MSDLSYCYREVTTNFGDGGTYYDKLGHRGADYRHEADEWILAYDDFEIQAVNYGYGLGWSVGVQRLTIGGFAGFAHIKNLQGNKGDIIRKGERLAQSAGWDDDHGSLWTGPHIHTTQGFVSATNCSVGIRPLSDPVPAITAAIADTAGDDDVPINPARKAGQGMASMFHTTSNDKSDGPVVAWALAGDGEGRAAWLEISPGSGSLANTLAGQHLINGTSAWLSRGTWLAWKADYLGVPRGSVTVTGNPKGI